MKRGPMDCAGSGAGPVPALPGRRGHDPKACGNLDPSPRYTVPRELAFRPYLPRS